MRGKAYCNVAVDKLQRITPAHAGKSGGIVPDGIMIQDHPRPCGEKIFDEVEPGEWVGSPPPMRGKVLSDAEDAAES